MDSAEKIRPQMLSLLITCPTAISDNGNRLAIATSSTNTESTAKPAFASIAGWLRRQNFAKLVRYEKFGTPVYGREMSVRTTRNNFPSLLAVLAKKVRGD